MPATRQDSFDGEDDSEDEEFREASEKGAGAAKPKGGRKKDPESQTQRKAQNRIAQREFRQRKQQYIRELETRVEVLSANSDERSDHLRDVLRALMAENTQLRDLVKDLGKLVGEGLGTCLPRLGMTAEIFEEIMNKGPAETALDAFVKSKERIQGFAGPSHDPETAINGNPFQKGDAAGSKRKRTADPPKSTKKHMHDPSSLTIAGTTMTSAKGKGRDTNAVASGSGSGSPLGPNGKSNSNPPHSQTASSTDNNPPASSSDPYPTGFNTLPPTPQPQFGAPNNGQNASSNYQNLFDLDPVFGGGSSSSNNMLPSPFASQSNTHSYFPPQDKNQPYLPQPMSSLRQPTFSHDQDGNLHDSPASGISSNSPSNAGGLAGFENGPDSASGPRKIREGETPESYFESAEVRAAVEVLPTSKQVAMQLIAYHLTNYRQNPAYHLPPSLVPTLLQRTVPHDHLIDGVVFSSLRDQMIVMRDQFDLGSALHLLFTNYNIHGEDVLSPDAWEISEEWLRAFPMLAHEALIASTNKWRLQRGLTPLVLEEIRHGIGAAH